MICDRCQDTGHMADPMLKPGEWRIEQPAPTAPAPDRESWWRAMTDEQRAELIDLGCRHCGSLVPRCYCQRDD